MYIVHILRDDARCNIHFSLYYFFFFFSFASYSRRNRRVANERRCRTRNGAIQNDRSDLTGRLTARSSLLLVNNSLIIRGKARRRGPQALLTRTRRVYLACAISDGLCDALLSLSSHSIVAVVPAAQKRARDVSSRRRDPPPPLPPANECIARARLHNLATNLGAFRRERIDFPEDSPSRFSPSAPKNESIYKPRTARLADGSGKD